MNATRFQLPPLPQPHYRFDEIPAAKRNLEGSTLQRVEDRSAWQACLGEMVLLCKEAVRRRRAQHKHQVYIPPTASKPLSLEYLADRSDVDDPLWGYMLRDQQQGRLQGFITVTTFTNYHRSFRWDSLHPVAFDDEHAHHISDQEQQHGASSASQRAIDSNGRLAQELQATVRAGDIWQEGIVWPRIAEISLLGGLGCGRTLLSLVLEDLLYRKSTPLAHYDYVVLQATENSVSFYESMGFIRVGALTTEANAAHAAGMGSPARRHQRSHHDDAGGAGMTGTPVQDWGSPMANKTKTPQNVSVPESAPEHAESGWIVGPAIEQFVVKRPGDTPLKIAQNLRVNAQDIVFLNLRKYPELTTTSRLKVDTVLIVPKIIPKETSRQRPNVEIQWYTAKENDTPRSIAKMFNVPCAQIVAANKVRLPGLLSSSRLKNGTKVRITTEEEGICWQPYSHWAFPEDDFEEGEPSYMMALKLPKPVSRKALSCRPVLDSLVPEITDFCRPDSLKDVVSAQTVVDQPLPPVAEATTPATPSGVVPPYDSLQALSQKPSFPPPPVPPKRPPAAFLLFCNDMRQRKAALLAGKHVGEASRILKDAYDLIPETEKQAYMEKAVVLREEYTKAKAVHDAKMSAYYKAYPQAAAIAMAPSTPVRKTPLSGGAAVYHPTDTQMAVASPRVDLFNKVVRLKPNAPPADGGSLKYTYWYVLTYIPDLLWCHLAPMEAVGTFGPDKPKAEGRPKYKLVDEKLGMEVDISSTFCIPVKARSMRKTMDADKEEWDVQGEDEIISRRSSLDSRRSSLDSSSATSLRSALKPSVVPVDRKRKRSSSVKEVEAAFLEAVRPDNGRVVRIKIRTRGRGRPPKNPKFREIASANKMNATTSAGISVLRTPPRHTRSSDGGASSTESIDEEESSVCDDDFSSTTGTSSSRHRESNNSSNNNSSHDHHHHDTSKPNSRPKRIAAPSYLGESPMSPHGRIRREALRGRTPTKKY
jgi:hypothetical protein